MAGGLTIPGNLKVDSLTIGDWILSNQSYAICKRGINSLLEIKNINTCKAFRISQEGLCDVDSYWGRQNVRC